MNDLVEVGVIVLSRDEVVVKEGVLVPRADLVIVVEGGVERLCLRLEVAVRVT